MLRTGMLGWPTGVLHQHILTKWVGRYSSSLSALEWIHSLCIYDSVAGTCFDEFLHRKLASGQFEKSGYFIWTWSRPSPVIHNYLGRYGRTWLNRVRTGVTHWHIAPYIHTHNYCGSRRSYKPSCPSHNLDLSPCRLSMLCMNLSLIWHPAVPLQVQPERNEILLACHISHIHVSSGAGTLCTRSHRHGGVFWHVPAGQVD